MDMEQVHDTSVTPDSIRQDVSRSPGGDSRVFMNNCIGCHSGMDPLARAFAYYNYDDDERTTRLHARRVQPKYFNNNKTFPDGFVTPDDSWNNHWRQGQNALIGWSSGPAGQRPGREVARPGARRHALRSRSARCKKVFKTVCFRDAGRPGRSRPRSPR